MQLRNVLASCLGVAAFVLPGVNAWSYTTLNKQSSYIDVTLNATSFTDDAVYGPNVLFKLNINPNHIINGGTLDIITLYKDGSESTISQDFCETISGDFGVTCPVAAGSDYLVELLVPYQPSINGVRLFAYPTGWNRYSHSNFLFELIMWSANSPAPFLPHSLGSF